MRRSRGERNGCLLMNASARSNRTGFNVDSVEHPVVEPNPTTLPNPNAFSYARGAPLALARAFAL
ncbi:MAG TPA: hypothetical protein VGJ39_03345, partial [Vicinamibacterales bacterium]